MTNNTCFGSGLSRFILDQFIGYQEILMSSVKQLAEKETHKGDEQSRIVSQLIQTSFDLGYVRNVVTNDHFRFVSAWQNRRWWTYLVALCIMIVFVSPTPSFPHLLIHFFP